MFFSTIVLARWFSINGRGGGDVVGAVMIIRRSELLSILSPLVVVIVEVLLPGEG